MKEYSEWVSQPHGSCEHSPQTPAPTSVHLCSQSDSSASKWSACPDELLYGNSLNLGHENDEFKILRQKTGAFPTPHVNGSENATNGVHRNTGCSVSGASALNIELCLVPRRSRLTSLIRKKAPCSLTLSEPWYARPLISSLTVATKTPKMRLRAPSSHSADGLSLRQTYLL